MKSKQAITISSDQVYDTANRPHPLVEEVQALYKYKYLIYQFVSRTIRTRYKRSVLGIVWTVLNPLLTMLILTFVFSNVFRIKVENYPVYVLSGLVVWSFFSSTTSASMGDMLWSGSLLNRIYLPKSVFAVSAIGSGLFNLFVSLIPLTLIAVVMGIEIRPTILILPLSILLLAIFSLGMGLLLSTAGVYFADMLPVYEVLLTMWMYATPIIYPLEIVPENLVWLLKFNPVYYLLEIIRQPFMYGAIPEIETWLIATIAALISLIIGSLVFTSKSNEYAYRI
jgi:ABC-type polysaccharide/polyol phosphate export permease